MLAKQKYYEMSSFKESFGFELINKMFDKFLQLFLFSNFIIFIDIIYFILQEYILNKQDFVQIIFIPIYFGMLDVKW